MVARLSMHSTLGWLPWLQRAKMLEEESNEKWSIEDAVEKERNSKPSNAVDRDEKKHVSK
jgi:hypothetical protein